MTDVDVTIDHERGRTTVALFDTVADVAKAVDREPTVALVVVDARVWELHGQTWATHGSTEHVVPIPAGESAKSMRTLHALWLECARRGLDRGSEIVAMGGGATTDVVGFAAATWMRGIRWTAVPTTLLGMVDASIGGKTGIDLDHGKNLVGAFHHPERVWVAPSFLDTLPSDEMVSGSAEVIKAAAIADRELFRRLEGIAAPLTPATPDLRDIILASMRVKAAVVGDDEREAGRRAILNFGHTVGHAAESAGGLARWRHGHAVAIGMSVAAALSTQTLGFDSGEADRLARLLHAMGLPTRDPGLSPDEVGAWLARDKKSVGGSPRFVLTPELGSASFGHEVPQPILQQTLARFFGSSTQGPKASGDEGEPRQEAAR